MAAVPKWRGSVKDGRLHLDDRPGFDAYAQTLDGKRFELVLRRETRHHTGNQRRYFHGCVVELLAEYTGNEPEYMKALLKLKFLWDGESVDKYGLPIVPSTADLSVEQYTRLIDQSRQLGAEIGCPIPDPSYVEA